MKKFHLLILICFICLPVAIFGQITIGDDLNALDYAEPRDYEIGGITFTGVQFIDNSILLTIANISVGDKIKVPGEKITKAITKLWDQGLFENIAISATKITNDKIFLNIHLTERPRLSKFTFTGVRKGEIENLREEIKIMSGDVITENVLIRTRNIIKSYYIDKGFLNVEVDVVQRRDTTRENNQILFFNIKKNGKVKIKEIQVNGNTTLSDIKIRSLLKETKERGLFTPFSFLDSLLLLSPRYLGNLRFNEFGKRVEEMAADNFKLRIFKSSKFIEEDYFADRLKIVEKYNALGYRDARLVRDTIRRNPDNTVSIELYVDEGRKYYFRNITWVGNTKYSNQILDNILKIKKGDIYNQEVLDANLSYNPNSLDISSLYLDDGYLFFNVEPVEIRVENDSIDLEIRIREGKQARINKVMVKGNTKTNDHVVIREIRTRPGQLFSRSDIIRTTRELAQLRYFDAEKIQPVPKPNPTDGTVDLEYSVEETSSDQIELSGGWGYGRVVGTLGVSFNNFSLRNILKKSAWNPVPSGDGQKLSIRLQSYGIGYLSYNVSFTEPWLGGKKPNAFSVSYFHSLYSNSLPKSDTNRTSFVINGVTIGLGKRLKWPDDYFSIYHSLSFQRYDLHKYSQILAFSTGYSHNFSYGLSISRNSIDAPIFPRQGSEVTLSVQATAPYSFFSNKDYADLPLEEKYRWIEYHKWKILAAFNTKLVDNFVLHSRVKYGFLGMYNRDIGITPFERFYIGGDGLSGYNNLDGRELVGLRGYANESVTPNYYTSSKSEGGTIYAKYTLELRYPISLNPNSTIYGMGFLEAGNAWLNIKEFTPFKMKRSAGIGVRVFLPMFGVLGLDWGYGLDKIPGGSGANGGQFHFSINQSID